MSAYLPHDWRIVGALSALFAFEVLMGYALNRLLPRDRIARLLAWLMTLAAGLAAERLTTAEPPGMRMVALILALLYGMKAIIGVESGAAAGTLAGVLPALVRHAPGNLRSR